MVETHDFLPSVKHFQAIQTICLTFSYRGNSHSLKRTLALSTVVLLSLTIYINFLAGTGQINGVATGEMSNRYPTLFTPAGFTFAIWSIIYLLNITFAAIIAYQAFKRPERIDIRLLVAFILVCIFNIGWIFAWHYNELFLSVILMISLLYSLIYSFRVARDTEPSDWQDQLVRVNFSVYLGWISVATIANVTVLLISKSVFSSETASWLLTIAVMVVAVLLAAWMLIRFNNMAYALVVAWAFWGIYSANVVRTDESSQIITLAASVGIVLVLVTSGYAFSRKFVRLKSPNLEKVQPNDA